MRPISPTDCEPPYDRALALASLVRTMRGHYLAVRCSCGGERVIGLEVMARDRRYADLTLAHVALRLNCSGCKEGPDEVYLCATPHGLYRPQGNGGILWILPLVMRDHDGGARRPRYIPGVVDSPMPGEMMGDYDIHRRTKPPEAAE